MFHVRSILLLLLLFCTVVHCKVQQQHEEEKGNDQLNNNTSKRVPAGNPCRKKPPPEYEAILRGELFFTDIDTDLNQTCRTFPLWLGNMRTACIEHTNYQKIIPNGGNNRNIVLVEQCLEMEFLDYMTFWLDCTLEENMIDEHCYIESTEEITSYFTLNGTYIFTIDWALSSTEAFVVQSLRRCIRYLHIHSLGAYTRKSQIFAPAQRLATVLRKAVLSLWRYILKTLPFLANTNRIRAHSTTNSKSTISNSLSQFAPGVFAQIHRIVTVAWEAAGSGWSSLPDPQTLPILSWNYDIANNTTTSDPIITNNHSESTYTVVVALSDPDFYQGGELKLSPTVTLKPERLTAIIFKSSDVQLRFEPIVSGEREFLVVQL